MAAAAALVEVHQVLQWIGFGNQAHRDSICEEGGFELLEDFVELREKDIREMADGFEKRTQGQGRCLLCESIIVERATQVGALQLRNE